MSIRLRKKSLLFWNHWVKPLTVVIFLTFSFRSAVAELNVVPTGSMKPSIVEGDRIWVNKLAYDWRIPFTNESITRWADPQRGDVVVFFSPQGGKRLVKRVVGLPGDTIEVRNHRLIISGTAVQYPQFDQHFIEQLEADGQVSQTIYSEHLAGRPHPVMIAPGPAAPGFSKPVVLLQDQYFVLGDNRSSSKDSRSFGFVPRDKIVGRSSLIIMSLDASNSYMPRWHRFFRRFP